MDVPGASPAPPAQPASSQPFPFPNIPNPISAAGNAIGGWVDNAKNLYASSPALQQAVVNDPLYRASKAYINNASAVLGGYGIGNGAPIGDNTHIGPDGKVALGPAPPAPIGPPLTATPGPAGPALVPNPATKGAGPSPAMNVPLANPADIQGILEAEKGQQTAQQRMGADQVAGDEDLEKQEGGAAADAKINEIESSVKAERKQKDAEAHYGRIRDAYDKLSQMSVDPNRYAKSLDTGHKVMQTLANIFGGFSAGIHGGPNQAIEDYQRRVQQDIDSQKDNIANGYKSVAGQEGLYEQMLKATGTPQEAEALTLTAHQEAVKHALGKIMASTASRQDYDKARAAYYAASQQQHETMIKYHKYFPAGALGGTATPGSGPKAEDVDSKRAVSAISSLERDGDVPGTGWTDRLRHFIGEKTGLGGSVESSDATRFYSAKDALVAAKMKLEQMSRINPDNVRDYGKRWQTTEQIDQLKREVEQGIADKQAIPAKGGEGKGKGGGHPTENDEEEVP